jgi:cell division protein FtsZ
MNQDDISFDLPKNKSNVIKVIGVGGGGSNAVNYMYSQGFKGVDFVVCNTDAQALLTSPVPNKIQLGVNLTEGLGAGASPEVGGEAALESIADLEAMLSTSTKMLFLTAGMGGGTGTGAAPVIAKLAAKLGILTVGIVTMPFKFEGTFRLQQAQAGMEELQKYVDSMIVINNNKLRDVFGNLGLKAGFAKADEVLATAARGISEVITRHSGINIDLRDAKTVLEKSGTAIMGAAVASGEDRAKVAITKALDSPLLNDNSIKGAKQVLLLIVSGEEEITLDEMGEINEYIQEQSGGKSNIIMGVGEEEGIGDGIKVTVVATGFSRGQQDVMIDKEPEKTIHILTSTDSTTEPEVVSKPASVVKEVEPVVEKKKEVTKIVHKLEEEVEEPAEFPISRKIVYTLEEDEEEIEAPIVEKVNETVAQPQAVVEESIMDISDDEIVIQEVKEAQTTIEFDFESNNKEQVEEKKVFDLGSFEEEEEETFQEVVESKVTKTFAQAEAKEVEAKVEQEQERFIDGSIRYKLEDYEELENKIDVAKPSVSASVEEEIKDEIIEEEEIEPEMQIHIVRETRPEQVKVVEKQVIDEPLSREVAIDPTEIPLSKKDQIGRERRERLKRFNHNFKSRTINPSSVDDLERQPAYLRAGIDLSSSDQRKRASRYSIGNNGDEDVVLKRNNSFLHDNVD